MTLSSDPDRQIVGHSFSQPIAPSAASTAKPAVEERLEALFRQMIAAVNAGEVEAAESLSAEALALAKREASPVIVERFECNRANILAQVGRGAEAVLSMRKLLMRSKNVDNRFLASYGIAHHHFRLLENERSMFYARQALRYAEEQESAEHIAWCNNIIGILQLRESYFEEACLNFEEALKFYPAGYERAGIQANLGYCLAVTGRMTVAFRHLVASLRMMNHLKLGGWRRFPHLALAYAYLEIGRVPRAVKHASRSLEISAATAGAEEQCKNSLYLLGEAKKISGHDVEAWEHFSELQKQFYPEQPFIVDVLMATDVRKMINLMA